MSDGSIPADAPPLRLALIAHDGKKDAMVALARDFVQQLRCCTLLATGMTCASLVDEVGLAVEFLDSGPDGGDAEIAIQLARGKFDAVFFLRDPMFPGHHEPDINVLVRACDVHDVPCATNVASARLVMNRLLSKA